MVRRVAWSRGLDDAEVDEVLQEVRLRLWRARGTSEHTGPIPASYVYQAAVSSALDLLRRRRARGAERHVPIEDQADVLASSHPSPAADVEASELAELVARAVDTIPASRRPVVRMFLAGYPREEIGELLGWSEAKTRNLLYRGLADLRARLAEWGVAQEERR